MASSPKMERRARLRWISLGKMKVSSFAQRRLVQSHVDHLLSEFDPELVGNPHVSSRDEHYYIVDGQHRVEALKKWLGDGWEGQQIQCWTYFDLTEAEEADLFDRLNDVKNVSAFDKFRVRVNAGRPIETDIERQVRLEGLVVSREKVPGAIGAVGTLKKVYLRSDAPTLGRTLRIIRDAYGDAGFEASVIDGIGHLCQRYNGQLNDDAAVKKLSSANGGVAGLLGKAELLRKQTGNGKALCVAAAAVETINRGGGKKLPSWWKSG
jgi:hypothetical protein